MHACRTQLHCTFCHILPTYNGWLRNPAPPWMIETLFNGINYLSTGAGCPAHRRDAAWAFHTTHPGSGTNHPKARPKWHRSTLRAGECPVARWYLGDIGIT